MELKPRTSIISLRINKVLIVPFMELKHQLADDIPTGNNVLIVPFMELKPKGNIS